MRSVAEAVGAASERRRVATRVAGTLRVVVPPIVVPRVAACHTDHFRRRFKVIGPKTVAQEHGAMQGGLGGHEAHPVNRLRSQ